MGKGKQKELNNHSLTNIINYQVTGGRGGGKFSVTITVLRNCLEERVLLLVIPWRVGVLIKGGYCARQQEREKGRRRRGGYPKEDVACKNEDREENGEGMGHKEKLDPALYTFSLS